MMIPKLVISLLTLTAFCLRLPASGDVSIDLSIESGSAFVRWSNQSQREVRYYHHQSTSEGVQFHGYQLYLIDEKKDVTMVYFTGESNASVPEFSELNSGETETTEIDLNSWIDHNEKFEMRRPNDGRYIAFIKYDDSEIDGVFNFKSLGVHFTSVTFLEIENGKIKK